MENTDQSPEDNEIKRLLISILSSLKPGTNAPEYRYAEALLIVFNNYGAGKPSIRFNRDDLYELITGSPSKDTVGNEADFSRMEAGGPEAQAAHERLIKRHDRHVVLQEDVRIFMLSVGLALTLKELCEKYGRELVIFEYERGSWIALDLNSIEITDIHF